MLKDYFKIAFRNMWKYKTQSLTGIFGLAFGLACIVPALYWLHYETSYDSFYPDAENIYRIYAVDKQSGKVNKGLSSVFEKKLREQFPAIEASTVFLNDASWETCKTEEIPHVRLHMLYTNSSFLSVFPQEFVCGDIMQPLQTLDNIILTESVAIHLFGDVEKAIGQHIKTTMNPIFPPYTVTAVVKDPQPNTNFSFDAIIFSQMVKHFADLPEEAQWTLFLKELFVKFHPDTDINNITEQLRDLTSRLNVNDNIELRMLPVSNVRHYLNTETSFTLNFIRLFVAAGALLLFSAVFNFLNLHLNLFRQRSRELRLRTVHGASSNRLIQQMLFELSCSILLALFLACSIIIITQPAFAELLEIEIRMSSLISIFIVCGISAMLLILFIGFITFWGLSHIAMQSQSKNITAQPMLRRIAVTLQLTVSIVFIVAALVIMMQIHFVNNKDLGFDRNGVIQLSGFTDVSGKAQIALMHKLASIPQIKHITDAYFEPQHNTPPHTMFSNVEWPGKSPDENQVFNFIPTDDRFSETFKLKILMGEWWKEGQTKKTVLNEEAVHVMRLSEPIGSIIRGPSLEDFSIIEEYEVAGVVNDFHALSLRSRIQPTIFIGSPNLNNILYIHVVPGQEQEAIQRITPILPDIDPIFMDARLTPISQLYDRLNQSEQIGLQLFSVLATVCLLISLFGIYAVATAATLRRRKEVAIRKVAGAEVNTLVRMFFREYTLQVIVAGVIGLPLAYIVMDRWLQGYAYRTNIPWWLLIGVIAVIIVVVLLTVLGQVVKAANNNPAEVIKSE